MCSCSDHLNPETPVPSSSSKSTTSEKDMDYPIGAVKTEISFSNMLEFAADNYVEGFKQSILRTASAINEMGLWYGRQTPSTKMVLGHKTPLMVASMYGSVDVVKLILSLSEVDVNCCCGPDKGTALHCAASSGSVNVVDVIKLLLLAGIWITLMPMVIKLLIPPLGFPKLKDALEEVLQNKDSAHPQEIHVSSKSNSPPLSSSLENGSVSSALDATCSPNHRKLNDIHLFSAPENREYLVDPSLPDIKNSLYSTDEFRMYSFKIHPCSRAYSHDWTDCPFVHLGEHARRRDPRKFHYSSVPCPDFRKGECRRGEMCEYSHGVFECWLHPAQYRTRICKEGTSCDRRVCFFAHSPEELRPLYVSSGAVVLSPRSAASAATAMDMAAALNLLPGGSPTAVSAISPTPLAPFMSPGNGVTHPSTAWPLPNIPPLHLPGSNLQMSHLRSSLNARDIPSAEFNMLLGFEGQQQRLLNELSYFSQSNLNSATTNLSVHSKTINLLNLDEIFSVEVSPPRFSDQVAASAVFSPSHQSVILNPLMQQQKMISPVNTNLFSPQNVDHPFLPVPFGLSSPGRTSMRGLEPQSPFSARIFTLVQHEEQQLSSRDLGIHLPWDLGSNGPGIVSSPVNSLSNWETSNGRVDWSVNTDELARVKRSFSKGCGGEEPEFHGFSHW